MPAYLSPAARGAEAACGLCKRTRLTISFPVNLLRLHQSNDPSVCVDGLVLVNITIAKGVVVALCDASEPVSVITLRGVVVDLAGGMVLPTFVDLHTHIDKGHTCERSRNANGALSGADHATAADAENWSQARAHCYNVLGARRQAGADVPVATRSVTLRPPQSGSLCTVTADARCTPQEDVETRMEFSLRAAYAHGTCAIRTHLMSGRYQAQFSWPAFAKLRERWRGRVELQGVALVVLAYFRDEPASEALADWVQEHGGVLGAAVSCSDSGGLACDDVTTCGAEMPALLDRMFALAKARDLDLDFHVDENGNAESKGLRHIAAAALRHGYQGRVVCGHCCSLAAQSPADLQETLELAAAAGITVVSLPVVNLWLQGRDAEAVRTPSRRGVTLLKELQAAGIPVALASDNTRDQFYAYGDLDLVQIFRESCCIGHLDRPGLGAWPAAITSVPAAAMRLREGTGMIGIGLSADFVVFRARCYSELFSRPQSDRLVVRCGLPLLETPPQYSELDRTMPRRAAGWAAATSGGAAARGAQRAMLLRPGPAGVALGEGDSWRFFAAGALCGAAVAMLLAERLVRLRA